MQIQVYRSGAITAHYGEGNNISPRLDAMQRKAVRTFTSNLSARIDPQNGVLLSEDKSAELRRVLRAHGVTV